MSSYHIEYLIARDSYHLVYSTLDTLGENEGSFSDGELVPDGPWTAFVSPYEISYGAAGLLLRLESGEVLEFLAKANPPANTPNVKYMPFQNRWVTLRVEHWEDGTLVYSWSYDLNLWTEIARFTPASPVAEVGVVLQYDRPDLTTSAHLGEARLLKGIWQNVIEEVWLGEPESVAARAGLFSEPPEPSVLSTSEPLVHCVIGAQFGDLEFDVGKSVRWVDWFTDNLFVLDVNLGTPRYWIVNWAQTFPDAEHAVTGINFFVRPVDFRKEQWKQYKLAFGEPADDEWFLFIDGHEGLSVDNRSLPDDYAFAPFKSFLWREIQRAQDNDESSAVLPYYVFLRSDHITNVSYGATAPPDPAGNDFTQRIAVPSYFWATWYNPPEGNHDWERMQASTPQQEIALCNPNSGPDTVINPDWVHQITDAHAAGLKVCGYVRTNYWVKPAADVKAEIDKYYTWYDVDGIFIDEVAWEDEKQPYYLDLYNYIKAKGTRSRTVIINPGTADAHEIYMGCCDIMMNFEGSAATYLTETWPSWVANYAPKRFWHCIHDVADITQRDELLTATRVNRAGYVYLTPDSTVTGDQNPYNSLPADPFWSGLVIAMNTGNPPPPVVQALSVPYYEPYQGLRRLWNAAELKKPNFDWSQLDTPVTPSVEAKAQILSYGYAHWNLQDIEPPATTVPALDASNDQGWEMRNLLSKVRPIPGLPIGGTWVSPEDDPVGMPGPWAPADANNPDPVDPVTGEPLDPPVDPDPELEGIVTPLYDCVFRLNMRDGVWYEAGVSGNIPLRWDDASQTWTTDYDPDLWANKGVKSYDPSAVPDPVAP